MPCLDLKREIKNCSFGVPLLMYWYGSIFALPCDIGSTLLYQYLGAGFDPGFGIFLQRFLVLLFKGYIVLPSKISVHF